MTRFNLSIESSGFNTVLNSAFSTSSLGYESGETFNTDDRCENSQNSVSLLSIVYPLVKKLWTGSKRIGISQFVDENGLPVKNLNCNLHEPVQELFKFPSEMTAYVSETKIVWQNSIPGVITMINPKFQV